MKAVGLEFVADFREARHAEVLVLKKFVGRFTDQIAQRRDSAAAHALTRTNRKSHRGDRFVENFPLRSQGFEVETEMTVHALEHSFKVDAVPVDYRERPEGSFSKLSTFGDGYRAVKTALTLFGEHRPLRLFSIISAVLLLLALVLVIPVFIEYFQTGLVPRFPTLIVSGFIAILAMLLWVGGVILEVISRNHWKQYELMLMHYDRTSTTTTGIRKE